MERILVVDDDLDVAETIARALREVGYEVSVAYDGYKALRLVYEFRPDLVVLDIIMPGLNGVEVCRRLRTDEQTAEVPILFLTAKSEIEDKIAGFEAGADDYMTKPFDLRELELRVRAILRRTRPPSPSSPDRLEVGDMVLDCKSFELRTPDRTVVLTPVEFELLHYMMERPDEVFSSERLLQEVWGYPPGTGDPALVRMHIRNIRLKIEPDIESPRYIRTISRHGYTVRPLFRRPPDGWDGPSEGQ